MVLIMVWLACTIFVVLSQKLFQKIKIFIWNSVLKQNIRKSTTLPQLLALSPLPVMMTMMILNASSAPECSQPGPRQRSICRWTRSCTSRVILSRYGTRVQPDGMCRRHGFYAAVLSSVFCVLGKRDIPRCHPGYEWCSLRGVKLVQPAGKLFGRVSLNDRCAAHKLICLCWQIDGGNGFFFMGKHKSPVIVDGVCKYYMTAFWQVDFWPSGYTIRRLI